MTMQWSDVNPDLRSAICAELKADGQPILGALLAGEPVPEEYTGWTRDAMLTSTVRVYIRGMRLKAAQLNTQAVGARIAVGQVWAALKDKYGMSSEGDAAMTDVAFMSTQILVDAWEAAANEAEKLGKGDT